jgi:hypothetical protein
MYVFLELCSPAKLYAFIAVLLLLYTIIKSPDNTRYDIALLLIKASIFIGLTFALNKLCSSGYKYIAWIVAIVLHLIYVLLLMKTQ